MLEEVCECIAENYNKNNVDYIEQTDEESNYSTNDLVKIIREKLITEFGNNIQITEIDCDDKISFKIIYKDIPGELCETFDRRGNPYWVVDFVVDL